MAAVGIAAARHPALQSQGDLLPPVCVARTDWRVAVVTAGKVALFLH